MFKIQDETETKRCSFQDAGQDLGAPESRELQRLAETFSMSYGETN